MKIQAWPCTQVLHNPFLSMAISSAVADTGRSFTAGCLRRYTDLAAIEVSAFAAV